MYVGTSYFGITSGLPENSAGHTGLQLDVAGSGLVKIADYGRCARQVSQHHSLCIAQVIPLAVSSSTPWRIYA